MNSDLGSIYNVSNFRAGAGAGAGAGYGGKSLSGGRSTFSLIISTLPGSVW